MYFAPPGGFSDPVIFLFIGAFIIARAMTTHGLRRRFAFRIRSLMMPVSTPQNAVVYGSGMIPITKMVRSGISFDIIGLIPVMARLFGFV